MRIALDAMGTDNAPTPDVEGAVRAARRFGHRAEIVLVGRQETIEAELAKHDTAGLSIPIVHSEQVITMDDHPAEAVRAKPQSSIVVGMSLVRQGEADAFVSMGNSGAVLAAALMGEGRVGRIRGIRRPAISTIVPTVTGSAFMLDIGANTDCKAGWLVQFAVMGAIYSRQVLGVADPRVALLSNGEEETKGSQAVQAAHQALKQLPGIRFVGNVEGKDLMAGVADVIVSDGFAGNVAIKTAEGVAKTLMDLLRAHIKNSPLTALGGLLAKPAFRQVAKVLDYRQYGGAPLLGVNGVVIIGHGRSDALAVENGVRVAVEAVEGRVVEHIRAGVEDAGGALRALSPDAARLLAQED